MRGWTTTLAISLALAAPLAVGAEPSEKAAAQAPRPDAAALLSEQRTRLQALDMLDGVWRGLAHATLPDGSERELVQTERVGPFLDGALKVIEGRGYGAGGEVAFNALGIVSWDVAGQRYRMRSYAMGHAGDFPLTVSADGFAWEIPAGPATLRYTATVRDGTWHEVGERVVPGQAPVRFFEMTLRRIGDSRWPAAGAVPPATEIEGLPER